MAVDPTILATAGIGAAGSIPGSVATLMPSDYQARNREELEKLLAREQAGKLGLSGPEQYALLQSQAEGLGVSRQAADAATRNALAGAGAGFGSGQLAAQAAQAEQARLAAAGRNEVAALDRQRAVEQKQEIEQRAALKQQLMEEDVAAVGNLVTGGAVGAAEGLGLSTTTQAPTTNASALAAAGNASYQSYIKQGYSPESAAGMSALSPDGQAAMGYFMGDTAPSFGAASY